MNESPRWLANAYQQIRSVAWHAPQLVVEFADGTRACVEAHRLLPADSDPVEWSRLTWSPDEIAVPSAYEIVIIPWSTVRAQTDAAYADHLARAADESARRIGARIRGLREARGLTGPTLAERAGITAERLDGIELGRRELVLPTLQSLLAAMGCSLRDLATDIIADEANVVRR